MRLTVYTDYALRLLMYLAVKDHGDGGLATISEVAERYGISRNHLMKVAYQLGAAGYIETVRGRGGGLRLAMAASEIGLGDIVRQTEPDMALVPCFNPVDAPCTIRPAASCARLCRKPGKPFLRRSMAIRSATWQSRERLCASCLRSPDRNRQSSCGPDAAHRRIPSWLAGLQ